jgi:long-chain acyl-CoA synthetase
MDCPDTIGNLFYSVASENPDRVALIYGEKQYTYNDLASLSSAYTGLFYDRLNLLPGHVLIAWLDNSPEFIASFLSTAETGAVIFPMNIRWRPPELCWFLDCLQVAGVVTKQSLRGIWDALADRIPPDRVIAVDDPAVSERLSHTTGVVQQREKTGHLPPEQHAVFLSSSGSSGIPKIVPRSHRNIIEGTISNVKALGITPDLRFMSIVPFYHGNGFDNSLALPLLSGATIVLQSDFAPSRFAEAMTRHRIDVFIGSPAIFELLLRFNLDPTCLSTLRVCASSGGPIAHETVEAIRKRFGVMIRQVYGSTETSDIAIEPTEGGPQAVPFPNVNLQILDSSGEPLPAGSQGEIAVRGPSVVSGYIGGSGDESRSFRNGYYCTGDLGYLDLAGNLTLLGRIRPIINLSGTKVDPVEVENAILALPGVSACRVFSVQGQRHNEIIKAVIAVAEGSHLGRADVVAHCRGQLAEYKIPRIIEFVPSIPSDLTGKSPVSWGGTSN